MNSPDLVAKFFQEKSDKRRLVTKELCEFLDSARVAEARAASFEDVPVGAGPDGSVHDGVRGNVVLRNS